MMRYGIFLGVICATVLAFNIQGIEGQQPQAIKIYDDVDTKLLSKSNMAGMKVISRIVSPPYWPCMGGWCCPVEQVCGLGFICYDMLTLKKTSKMVRCSSDGKLIPN